MTKENLIKSPTFRIIAAEQKALRLRGVGEIRPDYLLEDMGAEDPQSWLNTKFANHSNPEIQKRNETTRALLVKLQAIVHRCFENLERTNGPGSCVEDRTYEAHAYRCVRIVIDEFGIYDPMVLATTYLHDSFHWLGPEQLTALSLELEQNFMDDVFDIGGESFIEQLMKNLDEFWKLDRQHRVIARLVEQDSTPVDGCEGGLAQMIQDAIDDGFTPMAYEKFKIAVKERYVEHPETDLRYMTREEMLAFAVNGLPEDKYVKHVGHRPGGYAILVALMAQEIDGGRYPRNKMDYLNAEGKSIDVSAQKALMRNGLNGAQALIPLARDLDMQPAVRELQESAAAAFFPEQWQALQTALEKMSLRYQDRNFPREKRITYFDAQLRMNSFAIRREISHQLEVAKICAVEVSPEEFEERKLLKLEGLWDRPLLGPCEWVLIMDKKTPGSIMDKWLNDARVGNLSHPRWVGDANEQRAQVVLRETFKDPAMWEKYLQGTTDPLRGTLSCGEGLDEFVLDFIMQKTKLMYPGEDPDPTAQYTATNHYQTNRRRPNGEEAEEFRRGAEPRHGENGELLYERHVVLLLHPMTDDRANMPVELHFESVMQTEINLFDEPHTLYKTRDLKTSNENYKTMLRNSREALRRHMSVLYSWALPYYDELLEQETKPN